LIRANADFQLKYGQPQMATDMLEDLRKRDPGNLKTLAQLITAYSTFDPKKAEAVSKSLPSPDKLASNVDVDALESGTCTFGPKYIKKSAGKADHSSPKPMSPSSGGVDDPQKTKKKRKRKGKLPQNLDAPIDPERWLPRRERSYYKGKRRDKRREFKGPQGAAAVASELDASKTPTASSPTSSDIGSPRPGSSSAPGTATAGPRQQKPSAKNAKKKKKGVKW